MVTTHAVARMLGWSSGRVRSVDDILKPTRVAQGRLDRVLFFVHTIDVMNNMPPLRVIRISKKAPRCEGDFYRCGRWFRTTREPPRRCREIAR